VVPSPVDPRAARAHRLSTSLRSWLARGAARRGWRPAVLPFPGYGGQGRVRVLARVLMAPPGTDPAALRGVPGWRRLLTLELADVPVEIQVAGRRASARTDSAGLLDATLEASPEPGRRTATLTVGERQVPATVHVAADEARTGVVCDIDDTVWITGVRSPLRAAWRTFARAGAARRPVPGMAALLTGLLHRHPGAPVVYLSNGPWNLAGPVERFLRRHGFPPGALLMTDWGLTPTAWFRDGRAHKSSALERLSGEFLAVRWVLVGDDGEHDPELYAAFAQRHPDRVAAIALRQVTHEGAAAGEAGRVEPAGVPVVRARDGFALLGGLRSVQALPPPSGPDPADWLLTGAERGNDATRLRAWTTGNAVRALVHGRTYFPVLAEALAGAGLGDLVLFADWRGDPDELLTDDGPTVAEALSAAARRGALVKGLVWRSHWDWLRFSAEQNRNLSENVNDSGGEVLLDQRVRPFGSHHQKSVVVRHCGDPARDVAFLGGIDLGHGRRDDAEHGGDPQTQRFADGYGGSPAWHDVQVELRGPAVREVEDVFRERWEDPAALSRLPWQAVPDLVRRHVREPTPLPDPPAAGSCTVQLLRTYPNRWPGYPFAPDGERSAARAYVKAVRRARRLI
jgi:phosphatidate phosphatase APP1